MAYNYQAGTDWFALLRAWIYSCINCRE